MSFIRNTSLDGLNGLARGRERAPLRRVAPRWRGQRLESFRRLSGMSASAPLIPLRLDTPARLETSQDFGLWNERASQHGTALSRNPVPTRKKPLIRVLTGCEDEFRLSAGRVCPLAACAAFVALHGRMTD
jgi:hypothetical protein